MNKNNYISRTKLLAVIIAIVPIFSASLASAQTASTRTPLRVAYVPVAAWLPVWVAKEKGIFDKNGLDVTLTKFANVVSLPVTLGKQFDLAPATAPDLLNAMASGLNVTAVTGGTVETEANQSYQMMVRTDAGINSPKDLNGKRIATAGIASVMNIAFINWMKKNGGDPQSTTIVEAPFTSMMEQLKANRIDAVQALQPFVNQMKQAGFKSLGDPMLSVEDPVLFAFWIAEMNWARANQATLKRWSEAIAEAIDLIKSNDADARAILAQYTGLPAPVAALVTYPAWRLDISAAQIEVWHKVQVSQGRNLPAFDRTKVLTDSRK